VDDLGEPEGPLHERHYTVEQANAARPWVAERVERIQVALELLKTPQARAALDALEAAAGGGYPGQEVARPVLEILWAASELQAVDVVLRDVDRGLVDFPSIRDGEEVYLCWLADEPRVDWWHEPEDGFTGRRPL
jgi:hypothetical protein